MSERQAMPEGVGMPTAQHRRWPEGTDVLALGVVLVGLLSLVGPTFWSLAYGALADFGQGHELAVVAISAWLVFRERHALAALPVPARRRGALALVVLSLLLYVLARSQQVVRLEIVACISLVAGLLLFYRGAAGLRHSWFAVFFLLFTVPLPFELVLALTAPLKAAVSAVATWLLGLVGYPMARSGVVITIGQYELLVTEACAGLQTMFTLEAMGLLYASLRQHQSVARNLALAVMVVPVAFAANVVRVVVLALITYHFGDAAGQGFLHGFSGIVLFVVALALIVAVDQALPRLLPRRWGGR